MNAASVEVCAPFGGAPRSGATLPVRTSAMLWEIAAAFGTPGLSPATSPPRMNCANEYPAATVVRSLTTMSPAAVTPSAAASRRPLRHQRSDTRSPRAR
ncbi:hypothetical protein ACFQZC_37935 [Streptacidiphilus monticola]